MKDLVGSQESGFCPDCRLDKSPVLPALPSVSTLALDRKVEMPSRLPASG